AASDTVQLVSHLHLSLFGDFHRSRTCTSLGVHDRTTGWPGATGFASKRASGTTADNVSSPATSMPTCTVEARYSTERVMPESEVASTGATPGCRTSRSARMATYSPSPLARATAAGRTLW